MLRPCPAIQMISTETQTDAVLKLCLANIAPIVRNAFSMVYCGHYGKKTHAKRNNYRLLLDAQFEAEERRRRAVREAHAVAVHIIACGRFDDLRDNSVLVAITAGASDDNTVTCLELRLARLRSRQARRHQAAESDFLIMMTGSTDSVSMHFQTVGSFGWFGQSGNVAPSRMMISRPQHTLA
jgi:hypothetical protein